jgi:HlyD family secretion protein
MKKLIAILAVLWAGGALGLWFWNDARAQRVAFRTVAVHRGDVLATINATGTIEPEEVVDVGVQIAGEIQSFGTDLRDPSKPISYGSRVEQGTVLARLDDSLFKARHDQANAGVERAEADVAQAQVKMRQTERELERTKKLQAKSPGMVSQQEYDTALANFEAAQASVKVAKSAVAVAHANLEEATVNLSHTTIRSPVKGVILDRRVNIGQTVVASLNAPSLFLIAKDLSRVQIWASVNETDVGSIHNGQAVRFTVSTFPGETFRGRVSQIRLNASMAQNVVTYTVVVEVGNEDGRLLPFLTARLQFEVEERTKVLTVPSAALRWQPKVEYVAPEAREEFAALLRKRSAERGERSESSGGSTGTLWVRRGDFVRPVPVQVGLTDGVITEVITDDLNDGTEVVLGTLQQSGEVDSASPFLPKIKNDKIKR